MNKFVPPKILNTIHKRVLKGFHYVDDKKQFGVDEHWRLPPDVDNVTGDCDDFAIACRSLVKIMTDYPTGLCVCLTETKEWHLVCAVGHWILDNRQKKVLSKSQLERKGYIFKYISGNGFDKGFYKV